MDTKALLRQQAEEIADAGHCGWGNTMLLAADEIERLNDILQTIEMWSKLYPLDIFPEPNFKLAAEVLEKNGMTLDAISAINMRHVLSGIARFIGNPLE